PGFVDGPPELRDLSQERLRPKQVVGHDVGVDDRRHWRPTPIQASTSRGFGRRVWRVHACSISSKRAWRSPTCCSRTARTSCSIERRLRRARLLSDLTTLVGTFRTVSVAMDPLLLA